MRKVRKSGLRSRDSYRFLCRNFVEGVGPVNCAVSLWRRVITVFNVFQFVALLGGAMAGYRIGHASGGTVGAIAGVVVGASVGWRVGRVPQVLVSRWLHRSLRRANSADLRSRLEGEYFISHLIIAELVSRGEPVESLREVVTAQLNSDSPDVRRFGRANAQTWFPELLST